MEPIDALVYFEDIKVALDGLPLEKIAEVVETLEEARDKGGRVYLMGNGGSATTASHFAGDLNKSAGLKAMSLVDSNYLITALANDHSFGEIFWHQMVRWVTEGDIVIGISGSGNSPNIILGLEAAKELKAKTIALTGFDGGKVKDIADISLVVPSNTMEQIEDIHLIICHLITTCLREG